MIKAVTGIAFLVALFSALVTGVFRRYALMHSMVDVPNDRSSHTLPTPRGGGVAIVSTFLLGLLLLAWLGWMNMPAVVGLLGGGLAVALLGFLDDRGHIAASWRLLVHFIAAIWVLGWLGGLPSLPLPGFSVNLGWLGHCLAVVYLVWLLNLYNFMDGIDGLASIEAVTVCIGGAVLAWLVVPGQNLAVAPVLLMAAVVGFLVWNYPPAKIFMGDAGSGFLGLMLGGLSIQAAWANPTLGWSWVILLGVFVVDATTTLLRRIFRRERFYEAHRCHAYQHAARTLGSHEPVTLVVAGINLAWLLPIAVLVSLGWLEGIQGVALAYIPLVWLALYYRAGARELQEGMGASQNS